MQSTDLTTTCVLLSPRNGAVVFVELAVLITHHATAKARIRQWEPVRVTPTPISITTAKVLIKSIPLLKDTTADAWYSRSPTLFENGAMEHVFKGQVVAAAVDIRHIPVADVLLESDRVGKHPMNKFDGMLM